MMRVEVFGCGTVAAGRNMKRTIVAIVITAGMAMTVEPAETAVVHNGKPLAGIVVAKDASSQVLNAANILAQYIERASGARIPIVENEAGISGCIIRVGMDQTIERSILPKGLDGDGFVISAKGNTIAILGPTDWGTEFGIYEFLERFVGVRWLLPGPDGTDVPHMKTIAVPEGTITDAPVFFSRLASGFRGSMQTDWARFNRMHGRVNFHHNLRWLFPPEKYATAHPEFYPLNKGGTRYIPRDNNDHHWQPCFTAPGIVDEAVKNINEYFEKNPTETSYSLGMNDNASFCECENCRVRIPGKRNSLWLVDYSDLYYEWCNKVIEKVLVAYPDKYFGCLAYNNIISPPRNVLIHPRLIPFITYDRMKWIDPTIAVPGREMTDSWAATCSSLGWYDYLYGSPYMLPRVFFHQQQEYLLFGERRAIKAQYAELYPNWGEGPKPYIMLKLWWDPGRNVDEILKEWYVRCVGEAAAPYLEKYYAIWEKFWTKKVPSTKWFKSNGTAQYLDFATPGYLEDVEKSDVYESRRLIDQCVAAAVTDGQKARARILETAFRYYEAAALAYAYDADLAAAAITGPNDALRLLNESEKAAGYADLRITLVNDVFSTDPILIQPIQISVYKKLPEEEFLGFKNITRLTEWLSEDGVVRRRAVELAKTTDITRYRAVLNNMLSFSTKVKSILDGTLLPLSKNVSFENGDMKVDTWNIWTRNPIGTIALSDAVAHSGKRSIRAEGVEIGCPVQDVPFPGAGTFYGVMWVYSPPGQVSAGQVELKVEVWGERKNLVTISKRVSAEAGKWTMVSEGGAVLGSYSGEKPVKLRIMAIGHGFDVDGGTVFFDDVGLYKIQ